MGVLTDFVIAARDDAQRVCGSACPSQDFTGLDAKGIDTVKLGSLRAILTDSEWDVSFMKDSICEGGEDGPWVFELPPDFIELLAKLDGRELMSAGKKWAATEEFSPKYINWPPEEVQHVLEQLAALCRQATGEGKSVLMWMCL